MPTTTRVTRWEARAASTCASRSASSSGHGGSVSYLASAAEPPAVHAAPGVGRADDLDTFLSRWRAPRSRRQGESSGTPRNHQRSAGNKVIGWRSIEGIGGRQRRFGEPSLGCRPGTEARTSGCTCRPAPPGGKVGAAIPRVPSFGYRDAASEIREDLRRFKQIVETGESTRHTDGQALGATA